MRLRLRVATRLGSSLSSFLPRESGGYWRCFSVCVCLFVSLVGWSSRSPAFSALRPKDMPLPFLTTHTPPAFDSSSSSSSSPIAVCAAYYVAPISFGRDWDGSVHKRHRTPGLAIAPTEILRLVCRWLSHLHRISFARL